MKKFISSSFRGDEPVVIAIVGLHGRGRDGRAARRGAAALPLRRRAERDRAGVHLGGAGRGRGSLDADGLFCGERSC